MRWLTLKKILDYLILLLWDRDDRLFCFETLWTFRIFLKQLLNIFTPSRVFLNRDDLFCLKPLWTSRVFLNQTLNLFSASWIFLNQNDSFFRLESLWAFRVFLNQTLNTLVASSFYSGFSLCYLTSSSSSSMLGFEILRVGHFAGKFAKYSARGC